METSFSANLVHQHHWIIETANGPRSEGVCKSCHAQRDFPNWLPDLDFGRGDDSSHDRRAAARSC